jgi:enoyl-[acyl-carrier-protein] reductase (NADH)
MKSRYLKVVSFVCLLAGAINQLTKNLACEWAKDNIRANSVAPWLIRTPLVERVRMFYTCLCNCAVLFVN